MIEVILSLTGFRINMTADSTRMTGSRASLTEVSVT
jgi:hypothetical protein